MRENCRVEIDLSALQRNFQLLCAHARAHSSAPARPICVLKADAYGHGATACGAALVAAGADFFAVASAEEGAALRPAVGEADILVLSPPSPATVPLFFSHRLTATVACAEDVRGISSAVAEGVRAGRLSTGASLPCHLKLDSGMHRLGFPILGGEREKPLAEIKALRSLPGWRAVGVYSHLAAADDPTDELTERQREAFFAAFSALSRDGAPLLSHLANSAGLLRFGSMGCTAYRPGIALYGLSPSEALSPPPALTPVLQMHARISRVFTLRRGERLGYGGSFLSPREMRVATVTVGYADGLLRACTGGTLLLCGRPCPIIGRICMDQCCIDLGPLHPAVGDAVTVYDRTGENLRRLAARAGSIPYELLTLISRRARRVYIGGEGGAAPQGNK